MQPYHGPWSTSVGDDYHHHQPTAAPSQLINPTIHDVHASSYQQLSSPHNRQELYQEYHQRLQHAHRDGGSRSPRREGESDYDRHQPHHRQQMHQMQQQYHSKQVRHEQAESDDDHGYPGTQYRPSEGSNSNQRTSASKSLERKSTFVVTKIRGANGAEEIFPVVASGYRHKLKVAAETAADEALIRRVLRKASTRMDDGESEEDYQYLDEKPNHYYGYGQSHGHAASRSDGGGGRKHNNADIVETESEPEEDERDSYSVNDNLPHHHGHDDHHHHGHDDHRYDNPYGRSRGGGEYDDDRTERRREGHSHPRHSQSPQRQRHHHESIPSSSKRTPERGNRQLQNEEDPSPARHRDRSPQQHQQEEPEVDRWRRIATPNPLLLHPPLPVLTTTTTATPPVAPHDELHQRTPPADIATNTSFAVDIYQRESTSVVQTSGVGVMTSPSLQPAPPMKLHAATSPVVVGTSRVANVISPLPGHHLPPSNLFGAGVRDTYTPFGPEVSSVRSSSAQSATPLPQPHTTPVMSHVPTAAATGAVRRTTLPPHHNAASVYSPRGEVGAAPVALLDTAANDVALASSTTSLMLSPRRRSSSPVSIVVASPRIAAAAANNTTEVYEVGTPSSLRHQRAPSSSQLQISSPVFLDTPLEEYVVPAGRAAATAAKASTPQKLLLSPHSAAAAADPLPTRDAAGAATPTKDVLRSYSHRSLFRPAREDIDAVRRISSSLHVVKSTAHHTTSSSSVTTTAQPQEAQVASSWC